MSAPVLYAVLAGLLGLLAFFEPCTIASHLLFAERMHRSRKRIGRLLALWLTRSLFLTALVLLFGFLPIDWSWQGTPSGRFWLAPVLLSVMAGVYLLSRLVYLPVPHLEFFRLWPRPKRLPTESRLGLTLPACTIPLFVLVALMSLELRNARQSVLLAFSFASMFSLPVAWVSHRGVGAGVRRFFSRMAGITPYLTAALLLGAALLLVAGQADLSKETLQKFLKQASLAGLGLGFLAGFVFSFNPVSFAAVPVMLAYVTGSHSTRRAALLAAAFIAGLIVTHVGLGISAALGGQWAGRLLGRQWGLVLSPVLFVLGLNWLGLVRLRLPWLGMRGRKVNSLLGAFLLGIPFSIAVCPFCAPALLVLLVSSAAIGSPVFGGLLLLAFAVGRSLPILFGAWGMGLLESLTTLKENQVIFEKIGGVLLLLSALYLLNEYFLWVVVWA